MADETEREALARLICTVRSVRTLEDEEGNPYRAAVIEPTQEECPFTSADVWNATPMVLMRANDFAGYVSPSRHRADDDWRDDPSADERWNAGCDFAITQLAAVLGIELDAFSWDAATEELEGDVQSVIGNALRAAFGEDWSPSRHRDEVEARDQRISELVQLLDAQMGTPCQQIRHQQEVEEAATALRSAHAEIARLTAAYEGLRAMWESLQAQLGEKWDCVECHHAAALAQREAECARLTEAMHRIAGAEGPGSDRPAGQGEAMIPTMCQRCGYSPCICGAGRIDLPPQPWECPRCGKMHGPASLTCDCKPKERSDR